MAIAPHARGLAGVLDTVSALTRDVVEPNAARTDQAGEWPEPALRALQAAGLGGLVAPEASGGLGQGLLALARVCEILGQSCASTALCYGMHCVGAAVIAAKATPDQQERFLEPISRGEHLTTLALSEPGTGAHFYIPETELRFAADGALRIRGVKSFVTSGGHADSYVISTVTAEPDAPIGQFSCVVVPEGSPGMVWGEPWLGIGMRGNSSRTVELRDVEVPRGNLLGEEGDQIWYVFEVVAPYFLMAMAGTYLGVAARALEEARSHLARRRYSTSGQPLAAQPVLQHRLGTLWSQVERARQLIYSAASRADSGADDALLGVLSAKAEAADCAVAVVNEAMTLTGGIAYQSNSTLDRLLRDARAAHIMGPTTDILRSWIGRALLGLPLLVE